MGKKIVINKCHGGFGLSALAVKEIAALQGRECFFFENGSENASPRQLSIDETGDVFCWSAFDTADIAEVKADYDAHVLGTSTIARDDAHMVAVVEQLGDRANGKYAELAVVEIPDDVEWIIDEYDGVERIAEVHRTWE